MRRRLFWALLLLVAVLGMHGLDCAGGDHETMAAAVTVDAAHLDAPHLDGAHLVGAVTGHVADAPAATHPVDATGTPPQPAHPSHALLACLAVLAAGIAAALVAWLALRRRRAPRSVAPRLRAALSRAVDHVAVPALDRLCVLRI